MPGVNLTRSEANERSRQIKVKSYVIDLDLTSGTETFTSSTKIVFEAITPGVSTFIDVVGKKIVKATLNGHRQLRRRKYFLTFNRSAERASHHCRCNLFKIW